MPEDLFLREHAVGAASERGMTAENPYCVRVTLDGELLARQGAMVAYRGELTIQVKGQGVKKLLKRAVTGEGLALMEISGRGEVWLADLAKNVFVLPLGPGDDLSVTGKSIRGFDPSLSYDIRMIKGAGMTAGGLFNSTFSGEGSLAITADGEPIVIPVSPDAPLYADTDAVIGWSAALQTSVRKFEGAKSLLKGGSGELFQLRLEGEGFVIVQPSEGPLVPKKDGGGDLIDELLG